MDEVKDFFARHRVDALKAVQPPPIKEVPPPPAELTEWDKWAAEYRAAKKKKKALRPPRPLERCVFPPRNTHCFLCGDKDQILTKHHTKPAVGGLKREGPALRLCRDCHTFVHQKWSNQQLRQFSFEEFLVALEAVKAEHGK